MSLAMSNHSIALVTLLIALFLSYAVFKTRFAKKVPVWVDELADLGVVSQDKITGTAIVCGGR